MSRQTEDGRHEGYVAHLFANGMYGGTWSDGPVADTASDGTILDSDQWRHPRTEDEIVGWRVICVDGSNYKANECWRGPVWTRVATAAEADPAQRRVYAPDGLDMDADDLIMADWTAHIAPTRGTYEIELAAGEVAEAQARLARAVRDARAAGASWEAIGSAAGMTRQSAHERWSRIAAARTLD